MGLLGYLRVGNKCNPWVGCEEDVRVGSNGYQRGGYTPFPDLLSAPPCPLSLTVTNEKEAEMMQEGGEEPIMLRHYLKTLDE